MIRYKINVLQALAAAGWTQTKLKKYGLISSAVLDRVRKSMPVGFDTLDLFCSLLHVQPGDIIECSLSEDDKSRIYDLECEIKSGLQGSTGLNKGFPDGGKGNIPLDTENGSTGLVALPGATKRKRGRPKKTVYNNTDTI